MPRKKIKDKEWPVIRYHKPRNSWVVDAGTKISPPDPKTGSKKRLREYYTDKKDAEARAELLRIELKNHGISGFKLTQEQQIDAEKALKIIKPFDVSITDAVKFYAEYHKLEGAEMTFTDLVDDFRKTLDQDREKGEGVADRTYKDYESRHNRLKEEFSNIKLISFSHKKNWGKLSRKLGKSSRRYENHIRILFNYAVEKEYLKQSPMKGKLSKAPKLKKPAILREDQWRQLLLTAIETDSDLDLLSYVVLILYMGLRPESEVKRIGWKNINFKTRKLFIADEETGKSDLGRTLEIPKVALELLFRSSRKNGKIIKSDSKHRRNWDELREKAGLIIKDQDSKSIKNDWVADIARHTAGSMVYAKTQSKEAVRAFLGHTNEVTMRYYVNHGESIDEEAERFYAFTAPLTEQIGEAV
jgi:integrase